jgi:oligopeptide transport system substrate-binding protein
MQLALRSRRAGLPGDQALPGYLPGVSLFPAWLNGVERGRSARSIPPTVVRPTSTEARRHLQLAKRSSASSAFRRWCCCHGDTPLSNKQSEYYQESLSRSLGLEIRIDKQIFKQRLAKMTSGDFDMVLAGWGPDYDDPLTFADLFASWNLNNRGRYNNPELDRWVRVAQNATDPRERVDAFGEIQRILIDDAVILPNYERGVVYVVDPKLQGLVRRSVGPDPDFTNARIAGG